MPEQMETFGLATSIQLLQSCQSHLKLWKHAISGKHQVILSLITWKLFSYHDMFDCLLSQRHLGLICMDCSNLARCVYRNNGWDTIPLEFCDSGQNLFCHEQEQRCSTSPGPCNQDGAPGAGSFSCTAAGIL